MDPYSSPYIIPNSSPNKPFPHSLLRTRQRRLKKVVIAAAFLVLVLVTWSSWQQVLGAAFDNLFKRETYGSKPYKPYSIPDPKAQVMILCLSLAKWGREEAQAQGSGVCPAAADATESQKLYCSCTAIGIQNVLRDIPAGTRQECSSWLETYAYSQAAWFFE